MHREADCIISVCGETFSCHRLVIQLTSTHIQTLLENADERDSPLDLGLPEVTARAFEHVMRFAYRGCVQLDCNVVGDVLTASSALSIRRLRVECVAFMTRTLGPDTCLRYWSLMECYDVADGAEHTLFKHCREVARTTFCRAIHSPRPFVGASDAVVEMLLRDDYLQVDYTISSSSLIELCSRRLSNRSITV